MIRQSECLKRSAAKICPNFLDSALSQAVELVTVLSFMPLFFHYSWRVKILHCVTRTNLLGLFHIKHNNGIHGSTIWNDPGSYYTNCGKEIFQTNHS